MMKIIKAIKYCDEHRKEEMGTEEDIKFGEVGEMLKKLIYIWARNYRAFDVGTVDDMVELYSQPVKDELQLEILKIAFQAGGWEGDGEIREMCLPAFLNDDRSDTYGFTIFTVKQQNNGTTFIAVSKAEYIEICRRNLIPSIKGKWEDKDK